MTQSMMTAEPPERTGGGGGGGGIFTASQRSKAGAGWPPSIQENRSDSVAYEAGQAPVLF